MHYNGEKIYLSVKEINKFQVESKRFWDCSNSKMGPFQRLVSRLYKKITRLNGYVYSFSVDYDVISVDGMYDIDKYLRKKKSII